MSYLPSGYLHVFNAFDVPVNYIWGGYGKLLVGVDICIENGIKVVSPWPIKSEKTFYITDDVNVCLQAIKMKHEKEDDYYFARRDSLYTVVAYTTGALLILDGFGYSLMLLYEKPFPDKVATAVSENEVIHAYDVAVKEGLDVEHYVCQGFSMAFVYNLFWFNRPRTIKDVLNFGCDASYSQSWVNLFDRFFCREYFTEIYESFNALRVLQLLDMNYILMLGTPQGNLLPSLTTSSNDTSDDKYKLSTAVGMSENMANHMFVLLKTNVGDYVYASEPGCRIITRDMIFNMNIIRKRDIYHFDDWSDGFIIVGVGR